jgi:hypothetical protein
LVELPDSFVRRELDIKQMWTAYGSLLGYNKRQSGRGTIKCRGKRSTHKEELQSQDTVGTSHTEWHWTTAVDVLALAQNCKTI